MIKIDWARFMREDFGYRLAHWDFIRYRIWFGWYWMDYDSEMHHIMKWYRMRDPDGKYRYTVKSAKGITQ